MLLTLATVAALALPVSASLAPRDPAATDVGYFRPLSNLHRCVAAKTLGQGQPVTLEDCADAASMHWVISRGAYCPFAPTLIQLNGTNYCMGVFINQQGITGDRSPILLDICPPWPVVCDDYSTAHWIKRHYWQWSMLAFDYCLDNTDGNMTPGHPLQAWECHPQSHPDFNNQVFQFDNVLWYDE